MSPLPELPLKHIAPALLAWYQDNRRDLPWRKNTNAYRIWLSEIMLQQTQIKTALPYYRRFLKSFPNIRSLAKADLETVLAHWSGLGYYSRARNLHRAAQLIVEQHGGRFPRAYGEVVALPGIGRYTAGAVLSIAFGQALPVLDGNVKRVLARLLKVTEPLGSSWINRFWKLLTEMVNDPLIRSQVGDFNQALMELGALTCTPRAPLCQECPISSECLAFMEGVERDLPASRSSPPPQQLHFLVGAIRRDNRLLLTRNTAGPFLVGLWELPRIPCRTFPSWPSSNGTQPRPGLKARLQKKFFDQLALKISIERVLPPVRHQITFRRLTLYPILARLESAVPDRSRLTRRNLDGLAHPSYVRKILQLI